MTSLASAQLSKLPQVTALGKPALLERTSNALLALRGLFKEFDSDDNNVVTHEEFTQVGVGGQRMLLWDGV